MTKYVHDVYLFKLFFNNVVVPYVYVIPLCVRDVHESRPTD